MFWPVLALPFLAYDDDAYVTGEAMVNLGLRPAAIRWAVTQPHGANWHPLTTLTHMAMCEAFGVNARAHHALNLLVHSANAALCFAVLRRLTGRRWPSLAAAALFALHPLRVESVAWVAELKDLLCGFFWLLAMWAHAGSQRTLRLAATTAALLSKPMAVTLPVALLLLDYWPLRRWPAQPWAALLREKWMLFAIAAVQACVTVLLQSGTGATDFAARIPFAARLGNAAVSYVRYLGKFFWPADLAMVYPHPTWWPWTEVLVCTALLAAISAVAWRSTAWVRVGWAWFVVTLLPAIGLIQVGSQAMADRYTYLPSLGLSIAAVWALGRWPWIVAAALVPLAIQCRVALAPWRDSVTLLERAAALSDPPRLVRSWLALGYMKSGRYDEARRQCEALIREEPDFANGYTQLYAALAALKRPAEAEAVLHRAVARLPGNYATWTNLAWELLQQNRLPEAKDALDRATRLSPKNAEVLGNLAIYHVRTGDPRRAEECLREALRQSPWSGNAHNALAVVLSREGAWREARETIEHGLWINPAHTGLRENYAAVLEHFGDTAAAEKIRAALALEAGRRVD